MMNSLDSGSLQAFSCLFLVTSLQLDKHYFVVFDPTRVLGCFSILLNLAVVFALLRSFLESQLLVKVIQELKCYAFFDGG